jgi:hypothetical protein
MWTENVFFNSLIDGAATNLRNRFDQKTVSCCARPAPCSADCSFSMKRASCRAPRQRLLCSCTCAGAENRPNCNEKLGDRHRLYRRRCFPSTNNRIKKMKDILWIRSVRQILELQHLYSNNVTVEEPNPTAKLELALELLICTALIRTWWSWGMHVGQLIFVISKGSA